MDPEPALPAWLVAQNLLTTLAVAQDWASVSESSRGQEENSNTTESARGDELPGSVRELINNMQEIGGFLDLDNAIEASLQVCILFFFYDVPLALMQINLIILGYGTWLIALLKLISHAVQICMEMLD